MKRSFRQAALASLVAFCMVWFSSSGVEAGFVTATFQSVSPGESFGFSWNGNSQYTSAGVFNWTTQPGSQTQMGNFETFCIDLNHEIGYGGTYTYQLKAPQFGSKPGMGIGKVNQLSELFGQDFNKIKDYTTAAAFQIDIWKTVYDTQKDLTSGSFQVLNPNGAAEQLAQQWLNDLNPHGPRADLVALTSTTAQDQVTINSAVPEPASLVLGGIGIAGLCLQTWRRRKAAK